MLLSPEVPGCQLAQAAVPGAENIQQVPDTPGDINQYVHTSRKDPTAERSLVLEFLFFFFFLLRELPKLFLWCPACQSGGGLVSIREVCIIIITAAMSYDQKFHIVLESKFHLNNNRKLSQYIRKQDPNTDPKAEAGRLNDKIQALTTSWCPKSGNTKSKMQTTKKPGNRHRNTIDTGWKQANQRRVKEKNTDWIYKCYRPKQEVESKTWHIKWNRKSTKPKASTTTESTKQPCLHDGILCPVNSAYITRYNIFIIPEK